MKNKTWHVNIITLFPEVFPGVLGSSLAGKGLNNKIWELSTTQLRDFANDKHKTVDDKCYGHDAGLLLKPDVVDRALNFVSNNFIGKPVLIYMSPKGKILTQKLVKEFVYGNDESNDPEQNQEGKELKKLTDGLIILCGRYEGIDDRVIKHWAENKGLIEISIGDYILSGGETAAMTLIDACVRLIPGIVHSSESLLKESFESGLLEFPQYTKPYDWFGNPVPDVLLSGDHKKIEKWQKDEAENTTKTRRPDMWKTYLEK